MHTTLDIINDMIGSTGTAPLTANDVNHPLYKKALGKLERLNRSVQKRGWWFNRTERTFTRNVSNEIILPSTCLSADPVDTTSDLVARGGKMYNPTTATYVMDGDVAVWFIELWEIEDQPIEMQDYLRCRATYEFYRDEEGDGLKLSEYKEERDAAWAELKRADLRNSDVNFFRGRSYLEQNARRRSTRLPT